MRANRQFRYDPPVTRAARSAASRSPCARRPPADRLPRNKQSPPPLKSLMAQRSADCAHRQAARGLRPAARPRPNLPPSLAAVARRAVATRPSRPPAASRLPAAPCARRAPACCCPACAEPTAEPPAAEPPAAEPPAANPHAVAPLGRPPPIHRRRSCSRSTAPRAPSERNVELLLSVREHWALSCVCVPPAVIRSSKRSRCERSELSDA